MDVDAHPFVLAGWLGTLITMLNLFPIGQLDADT
jgi:membrane-associated protease RseP (regulator of RpoE activity)